MNDIVDDNHKKIASELRKNLAVYTDAEDLINVGAYVKGSNPDIDKAINLYPGINEFLTQETNERFSFKETIKLMKQSVEEDHQQTE